MQNGRPAFKKVTFGGFNRDEVIDYIINLEDEFSEYKKDTDKIINELYERINTLTALLESKESKEEEASQKEEDGRNTDKVSLSQSEINEVTAHIKLVSEILNGSCEEPACKEENDITDENVEDVCGENNEVQEEQPKSFFDEIISDAIPAEPSIKERKASFVSQFDDLLKI